MKRWMLFCLIVLMLGAVSPACEPMPTEEPAEAHPTEAVVIEEPGPTAPLIELEPETIVFLTWASTPFEKEAVELMVRKFRQDYPQITVELTVLR